MVDKGDEFDTLAELMANAPALAPDLRAMAAREHARAALIGRASFPTLGRFEIHGELGRGGMGTVYAAFDPQLQRPVAIKVVRFADPIHREQMLGEARAMARLGHPNVVAVFEADTSGPELWIAMELVRGQTLRSWLGEHRAFDDIVTVFVSLGRGLAAAHAAGLIHGDFKPDNVLVSDDGRARIVDFGLARFIPTTDEPRPAALGPPRVRGTPGYLAPELTHGALPTKQTDVFALAVSLAEALFGQRLAAGDPVPTRPRFPGWVLDALRAGLHPDSGRRCADAEAFVAMLVSGRRRRRRRWAAGGAVALAAAAGSTMFVLGMHTSASTVDVCAQRAAPFEAVWNDARRANVSRIVGGLKLASNAARLLDHIDARARALSAAQSSSCEATFRTHVRSETLFEREMFCLQAQLADLDSVIAMVEAERAVDYGLGALARLAPTTECDAAALLEIAPPPTAPNERARVDAITRALAEIDVLAISAAPQTALDRVTAAAHEADAIGYAPLRSRAHLERADVLVVMGRFDDAHEALRIARDAAIAGRDNTRLVISMLKLAEMTAEHQDRTEEASAHIDTARSMSLATKLSPYLQATLHRVAAVVASARKDDAVVATEVATGLAVAHHIVDETARRELEIGLRSALAATQARANRLAEAEQTFQQVFELLAQQLGPQHPRLATTLDNLAAVQLRRDALDQATATIARARTLLEGSGVSRSELARNLGLQALIQSRRGRHEQAVATYHQVIALETELHGEAHRSVWSAKNNLAKALLGLGRARDAIELYRARLAWAVDHYGKDHAEVAATRSNLANALVTYATSDAELRQALEIVEPTLASLRRDDPVVTTALGTKARALHGLRRYDEAASAFGEALAIESAAAQPRKAILAYLGRECAKSLWAAGRRSAALDRARAAVAQYRALPGKDAEAAELAAWIAARKAGE